MVEFKKLSIWENWLGVSITLLYLAMVFSISCCIRFPLYGEMKVRLSNDPALAVCVSGDRPFILFGEIDVNLLMDDIKYSAQINALSNRQIKIRMEEKDILHPQMYLKVEYQHSLCELFWNMITDSKKLNDKEIPESYVH